MELLLRKHCIVTPSMLTASPRGLDLGASSWTRRDRRRMAAAAFASIAKNGLGRGPENSYQPFHLWGSGYYHFLTEVAPKLLAFEPQIRQGSLLIPKDPPPFIREILDMFEFRSITPVTAALYFRELSVITNLKEGHHRSEVISSLRDWIFDRLSVKHGHGRRVYISRSRALRRRVTNDEEVSTILATLGFETYRLEDLTFADQVRLMADTEFVIGLHGAGLTNTMFMRPGGRVIEFFPDDWNGGANTCFKNLAEASGLDHRFLFCKRTHPSEPFDFHLNDVTVDAQPLSGETWQVP